MAQGRKRGVDFSSGEILLHFDSDMKITPDLLSECVELIHNGVDAIVIPEESFGTTFWAKCKWLEKKCYDGNIYIESLRCLKKEIYLKLGGHNEKMVFSEDKDFDIRVRQAGYKIGRTKNFLWHNEGDLKLLKTLTKKLGYSKTANIFAEVHPKEFRWQSNPLNRYIIFLKNIKYLFKHPLLYIGMIYMKTLEYIFAFYGIIRAKFTTL
jgi:arabinofuranan 3-O-arabinosyltransferase